MFALSAVGKHSEACTGAAVAKRPHGNLHQVRWVLQRTRKQDLPIRDLTNEQHKFRASEERNRLEQVHEHKCSDQHFLGPKFGDKIATDQSSEECTNAYRWRCACSPRCCELITSWRLIHDADKSTELQLDRSKSEEVAQEYGVLSFHDNAHRHH